MNLLRALHEFTRLAQILAPFAGSPSSLPEHNSFVQIFENAPRIPKRALDAELVILAPSPHPVLPRPQFWIPPGAVVGAIPLPVSLALLLTTRISSLRHDWR